MTDRFDLRRFIDAQAAAYDAALAELSSGRKTSHWMWYVFPQIAGLGSSETTRRYAIRSLEEARAYLAEPLLGTRLLESIAALDALPEQLPERIFGAVDAMKLRSSLTLFTEAGGGAEVQAALERWFDGNADERTVQILDRPTSTDN